MSRSSSFAAIATLGIDLGKNSFHRCRHVWMAPFGKASTGEGRTDQDAEPGEQPYETL
jgi:hypothetical protein